MLAPLVVAVAQPLTVSHDVQGNAGRHAAAVREAHAHVVVFPEMSLTGYEFSAPAINPTDDRLKPIVDACRERGTVALVGAPVHAPNGGSSIAMLSLSAEGATVAYRKMWLSDAEARSFVAGDRPATIEVRGWRLGLAICKDTGVTQHASDTVDLGVDMYVAGVLEYHTDADVQPQRARRVASDHGIWVAVASFAGQTGEGFSAAAGGSSIWRPDGTAAASAGTHTGEVLVTTIDPDETAKSN